MKKLGANLDPGNLRPYFIHPNGVHRVFVVFDVCHMIKLLRNLWKHFGTILSNNQVVTWNYIEKLVQFQETEGLRAANKLTSRHSSFELQKMKVHLATQVFSSSVSKALRFCEELSIREFQGCGPTADFISKIDQLFDALNTKHPKAKGFKAPLSGFNKIYWKALFHDREQLLLNLHIHDFQKLSAIHETGRRTAIIGLITTIRSVTGTLEELVLNKEAKLKYIITYKLSQDHIETFFSAIRSVLGFNTNPNVNQFKAALKKVLTAKILPSTNGNCIPQDETQLSIFRPENRFMDHIRVEDSEEQDVEVEFDISQLSQFTSCVVTYIAGWVVRKIKAKVKCEKCLIALESEGTGSIQDYALIEIKQNGGLLNPSEDIIKICKTTETAIRQEELCSNFKKLRIQQKVLTAVLNNKIFENLSQHLFDSEPEVNHIVELTKLTVSEYLKVRMHHAAKVLTLQNKPTTSRNRNTTLTHFAGV